MVSVGTTQLRFKSLDGFKAMHCYLWQTLASRHTLYCCAPHIRRQRYFNRVMATFFPSRWNYPITTHFLNGTSAMLCAATMFFEQVVCRIVFPRMF